MTGVWVLLGVLVLGGVAGALLQARNGRIRAAKAADVTKLPERVSATLAPEGVTLVQISTTFCAPCRHTRVILSALAEKTDGLTHVDLDVTETPEVAQALSILRTPTTLALTPDGREVFRVGGVPRGQELLEALKPHLANV
ncbi:TlpA family protein disulfide reductase [Amycolatopsis azurea]|uniref:Thioredoxin n=1 Tax=Amycolatopsis azurea DSM 43854 TaxID=1238180 RepID=M2QQE3_9PSEU|nr:thioredoxin family protein [Amycolatopsis azurea]EMD28876.1 thioredoxin [Amycolatopsis azurea DSM 43854]OOC04144.1 thiol reductase thioredoxin [Amycolatopsis azurea DSM 43854]